MRLGAGVVLLALALSTVGCGDSDSGPPAPALSFAASTIVFPDTVIDRVVPTGVKSDVVFHPVSWSFLSCRLVFVEDTLVKGEAELHGQSSLCLPGERSARASVQFH